MKGFSPTHMTIVIVAFLAAIVALTMTGHETGALIAVGAGILGGLGLSLGQQQAVKEQTNGNTSRLMDMVENSNKASIEQARVTANLLALMTPNSPQAEQKVMELATTAVLPVVQLDIASTETGTPPSQRA